MVMLAGLDQEGHLEAPFLVLGEFGDRIIKHSCYAISHHSPELRPKTRGIWLFGSQVSCGPPCLLGAHSQ